MNKYDELENIIEQKNILIKQLEQELQKSTDQNDLVLDEFIRVKCLTDNSEIHQLCERAHIRMRQNVPVIERNHRMKKRIAELEKAFEAIKYNSIDCGEYAEINIDTFDDCIKILGK